MGDSKPIDVWDKEYTEKKNGPAFCLVTWKNDGYWRFQALNFSTNI